MASTAGAVPSSPATRAKALLDEAPGVYALRKRRRDSSNQTAPDDSPTASQGTRAHAEAVKQSTEAVTPSPATVNGQMNDANAPAPSAPPVRQPSSSVTHGQASSAPTPSASTPQVPIVTGEAKDDDDDSGDESDLTSLSELEEQLERETAQPPRRPIRRAKDISGWKTPRKRKTALSTAASSPASSTASTAASEYRPDETDYAGSSEVDSPLPMDVDATRPRRKSASPNVQKKVTKVSKKQQQASKPRRVPVPSKPPPVPRQHPAPAPTLQGSHPPALRPIKPAPATANKAGQRMEVVAAPPTTTTTTTHPPKRKRALPQATPAQTELPLVPAQERRDAVRTGTPRLTSIFQPAPMPSVMNLYERRHQVLKDANLEAARGLACQLRSEELIEAAISALDRRDQQDGLCLTMNRYSAFCDSKSVDVPPFPVTAAKVALFLARAPATPLSTLLLSAFPQPAAFPLPIAGTADPNLTPVEGKRVSRELVRFWVEALAYAQRATNEVWAPIFGGAGQVQQGPPQSDHVHPSLEPLQSNVAIQEIFAAVETSESIVRAEEMARQARETRQNANHTSSTGTTAAVEPHQPAKQSKTKWIKGGKPVAPPPPSSSSSGKTANSDQGVARSAPTYNTIETRHAPPATLNDAATRPAARHSVTKPVEIWQVTNAQVSPVLPIASAPISIPGRQAPVASTSRATLDLGHRRRSTTSDLALVDYRVPLPSSSWQQQHRQEQQHQQQQHQQHQHQHRDHHQQQQQQQQQQRQTWQHANDFPPPVYIGDANGIHPGQDPSQWAQQFPHEAFAMPPEPARRHSGTSTYAFELSNAAQWESPYEAVNGDAANYAAPFAAQQVTQVPYDQVPYGGYIDTNAAWHDGCGYGAASGSAPPIGASPFDMLAAVANDRMSAEPDLSQHTAPYEPRLPLNSSVNGEGVLAGGATSVPMRRGIEHFAGTTTTSQGGLQTPWASSDSSRRGSRAEPFDPSLADPSLSGLLHTRSQPHDHTFVASDSHFGHIADSALASLGPLDARVTYDAGSVSHPHPHPHPHPQETTYVRPSTYPTPDSPSTERWPTQHESTTWAASPTGIDAAFLQQVLSQQVGPATENNLEPAPVAGAALSPSSYTGYGLGLSYA